MIAALFSVLLAPLFAFASWVVQPVTATCPRGYYAEGVRPTGHTSCVQAPPGGETEVPGFTALRLPLRIFCQRPLVPLVRSFRSIGCGRVPGSRSGQYVASGGGGISP